MIRFFLLSLILIIFLVSPLKVNAAEYVLPYPSTMPGTFVYRVHVLYEKLSEYWYFGDFAQFDYNLRLSDKYLVESKTLFEYKQYLLGFDALKKSNEYFLNTKPFLTLAKQHGKDIKNKEEILHEAADKHIEVLRFMYTIVPSEFVWAPEKSASTHLSIKQLLNESIQIRTNYL